jgi:alkylation response protein AidB-like acyl-CoA dehydrogenase
VHGDPEHTRHITTERPDVLWGTDATCFWTEQDGGCWFFGAIDHDDIAERLASLKADTMANRAMTLASIAEADRSGMPGPKSSLMKLMPGLFRNQPRFECARQLFLCRPCCERVATLGWQSARRWRGLSA